nr:MAG TPA: hypothetical protein [Caudoviricetes sp.]
MPYPTQDRGHHTPHTPRSSTRPPSERERGTPISNGRVSTTTPPFPHHATRHPRWPHPPPRRGGSRQRTPHHTNSTDTRPPPTHHTPGNGTVHDAQQYSPALQWDE